MTVTRRWFGAVLLAGLGCSPGTMTLEGDLYLARDGRTTRGAGQQVLALRAATALLDSLDALCATRRKALDTLAYQATFLPSAAEIMRLEALNARLTGRPYRQFEDSSLRLSEAAIERRRALDSLHARTAASVERLLTTFQVAAARADVNGHFVFSELPADSTYLAATMRVDGVEYSAFRVVRPGRGAPTRVDLDSLVQSWDGLACDDKEGLRFFASGGG